MCACVCVCQPVKSDLISHHSFLIMDHPKESNMALVIKECKKYQVSVMVRVCEEQADTYLAQRIKDEGISHHVRTRGPGAWVVGSESPNIQRREEGAYGMGLNYIHRSIYLYIATLCGR